jgi:hypothetical protein
MTLTTKLILIGSGIVLFGLIGFIIYQQVEMKSMQQAVNTSMIAQKQLVDDIARSQSNYVSKQDLDSFAKQNDLNLADLKKDLGSLGATITGINHVDVGSVGQNQNNIPSTSTTPNGNPGTVPTVDCNGTQIPCPNADPFGYARNVQHLELNEQFVNAQVSIGGVAFDASNKNPWSTNIYPRTYSINNVLATMQDGRHIIYNRMEIVSNGKKTPIEIKNATFVEQYPSPTWSFFNPRLFLTAGGGADITHFAGDVNVGGTIGVISYGKTKVSPAVSIGQVGVVYETGTQRAAGILNPVSFNFGGLFPSGVVNNSFVGPSIQIDVGGHIITGGNLSVGF